MTKTSKAAKDLLALVDKRGLTHVKVGVTDSDGVLRGKYMSRDKFGSSLEKGYSFCDVVLGWDSNDQLYDNTTFTGWHTAYPDAAVRLLPETARDLTLEGDMIFVMSEFAGKAEEVCPRGTLRRVLERAAGLGYDVKAATEFEFFVFEETPHSVRDKNFGNLRPITPDYFGYSVLRSGVHAEFYAELLKLCADMRMPVEALHTETGPGVLEAAIEFSDALEAADRGVLFKTMTKILAQRRGLMATFMAKWSNDWPGQSGHLHMSLLAKDGSSVFFKEGEDGSMSDAMRWFIGGQQALMPELLAMVSPTVNAYSRLIPGFWAPTDATWGVENRTCALRVIEGGPKSQRVEYRVSAADINPYVALAAAIGSGLWGVENKIEPDAAVLGNSYTQKHPAKRALPRTLGEAAARLAKSKPAKELFGAPFVEHWAATRDWEQREFNKAITDWELRRYFEII